MVNSRLLSKDEQLTEKEVVIQKLSNELLKKQRTIIGQARIISYYSQIFSIPIVGKLLRVTILFWNVIRPRLGNLNQYAPRPRMLSEQKTSLFTLGDCPKISIVTPSYRHCAFIEKTLLSVLEQKYPNLEYFVQDGGSTDGTVAILKCYEQQLSGWLSESDSGQSQAINRAFSRTSGEIMGWLNSDDLLLPGALACVADYFNRHPDVDVVYGNRLMVDEKDMEIGRWIMPAHNSKVLSWVDYIPQETLFWRRRIWEKAGGQIDESFCFAMDWDLLVRFREAGAKFAHIPRFLGAFRIHEHQKTSADINEMGHKEMDRIRERVLGRVPSQKEIRKAVLPFLLKHIAVDMAYRVKTRLRGKS